MLARALVDRHAPESESNPMVIVRGVMVDAWVLRYSLEINMLIQQNKLNFLQRSGLDTQQQFSE